MRNRHAGHLRHSIDGARRAPVLECGVNLLRTIFAKVNHRVAVNRDERDLLVHRIDARQNHRVTAGRFGALFPCGNAFLTRVDTHEQHVERRIAERSGRCFALGRLERIERFLGNALMKVLGNGVYVRPCGTGADENDSDKDAGCDYDDALATRALGCVIAIAVAPCRTGTTACMLLSGDNGARRGSHGRVERRALGRTGIARPRSGRTRAVCGAAIRFNRVVREVIAERIGRRRSRAASGAAALRCSTPRRFTLVVALTAVGVRRAAVATVIVAVIVGIAIGITVGITAIVGVCTSRARCSG